MVLAASPGAGTLLTRGRHARSVLVPQEMPDGCRKCPLAGGRTRIVISRGTPDAPDVLFVGEAPGATEDEQGVPFVGRSGQLLDRWIHALGLERYLVSNICRCRPPNNRPPTREETEACGPHLAHLILTARPRHIVALGRTSERWLREHGYATLFLYHPSYYVRGYRKWEPDVAQLRERLATEPPLTRWLPDPALAEARATTSTRKRGGKNKTTP